MKKSIILISAGLALSGTIAFGQSRASGFYKDFFIDSGLSMSDHEFIPAARVLNLSTEVILLPSKAQNATEYELALTHDCFVGSDCDDNGRLLYPDGAPRYKMIYIPGGTANRHGESVTAEGREHIRMFFNNGGSYIGTCAGTILCSTGFYYKDRDGKPVDRDMYFKVWPGYTTGTKLFDSYTSLTVEKKCPLLKYYDFGGDMRLDSVRHNNGSYMNTVVWPAGTEALLRYVGDTLKLAKSIDKEISVLAYKPNEKSGRMVVTGSHPELPVTGERLQLFTSMFHYALDGNGVPQVKAALTSGEPRKMVKGTKDNDPAFTRIGDKQFHHFTIDVPKGTKVVSVKLESVKGYSNYDLFLYAAPGKFAFNDVARWFDVTKGIDKVMVIKNPKAGKLYISVYCDTTVDVVKTAYGEQYTGRTDVLNGVPYVLTATIEQ